MAAMITTQQARKLALAAMLSAAAVLCSHLVSIPAGFARMFPIQHAVNVAAAVMLGPAYAAGQAFVVSAARNLLGTGTLLAFPGSLFGAVCAGLLYKAGKHVWWAAAGEWLGSGIAGSLAAYPVARYVLGHEATLFGFMPGFLASSLIGAIVGVLLIKTLRKHKRLGGSIDESSSYNRRF